jgi:Flp pilus assembly protein TadG
MTSRCHHAHRPQAATADRIRAAVAGARGQALVEFALVLPVLLLMLMGMLFVGEALNESIDSTHLVGVAARYAAVNENPSTSGQTLQQYIASLADSADLKTACVGISFPNGTDNVGDPVTVTMKSTYSWIPLLKLGVSSQIVRTATMRLEAVPTAYATSTC